MPCALFETQHNCSIDRVRSNYCDKRFALTWQAVQPNTWWSAGEGGLTRMVGTQPPVNQTAPKQVRVREFADQNRTTVLSSAVLALSLQEPRGHSFTEPSRISLCGLRIYAKRPERELSAFCVNQMAAVFAPAEWLPEQDSNLLLSG